MKTMSLDLNRELEALDEQTAAQFVQTVKAMLLMVKSRRAKESAAPFGERIAKHPAIGTWPAHVNGDDHVARLREEW